MLKGHNPTTVAPNLLRPENGRPEEIYFHVPNQGKLPKWHVGYVQRLGHFVAHLSNTELGNGQHRKIAYEDIRLAPRNPLLKELVEQGLFLEPYGACVPEPSFDTGQEAALESGNDALNSTPSAGALLSEQRLWSNHHSHCRDHSNTMVHVRSRNPTINCFLLLFRRKNRSVISVML